MSTNAIVATPPLTDDLLRSIHGFRLPDAVLADVRNVQARRASQQREWERLDSQGAHHAVVRQGELAPRMIADEEAETALHAELAESTRKLDVLARLNQRFDEVAAEETRLLEVALNQPAPDPKAWDQQLAELGEVSRLRSRLGWAAETVCSHRKFRDRHDALKVLHGELMERAKRVERARGLPGDKPKFEWSETDAALIAALGRRPSSVKEKAHAV